MMSRSMSKELVEENKRLKGLLWFAWSEFNAVRARSGAPLNYDGMLTVSDSYWGTITNEFAKAIGPENTNPWMSEDATAVFNTFEID